MSNNDFTVEISKSSSRYNDWLEIFGTDEVILKHPLPQMGKFPGGLIKEFYELDLDALTGEQRKRLIKNLAQRFNLPEDLVSNDLDKVGCPILAEDVILPIKNPQKWL